MLLSPLKSVKAVKIFNFQSSIFNIILIYVKKGENFRVFLKFSPEKFGRSARNAYLCIRFRVEARQRDKKSFFERIT